MIARAVNCVVYRVFFKSGKEHQIHFQKKICPSDDPEVSIRTEQEISIKLRLMEHQLLFELSGVPVDTTAGVHHLLSFFENSIPRQLVYRRLINNQLLLASDIIPHTFVIFITIKHDY